MTPVSGSISTSQIWVPFGNVTAVAANSPLRSGRLLRRAERSSDRGRHGRRPATTTERSVPAMWNRPSVNSMSMTAASSSSAAILRASLDHLVHRQHDRGAADAQRAGAAVAFAPGQLVGVAVFLAHVLQRHAEPLRDDLAERRLQPLTHRHRAGTQDQLAVLGEAQCRKVLRWAQERSAGDLDAVGQADAAQLASFRGLRPALLESVEVPPVRRLDACCLRTRRSRRGRSARSCTASPRAESG